MTLITAIRANWKKTVFGVGLGAYAISYGREWYQISSLMKAYSEKAAIYGDQCGVYPRKLIVILNPAANKKKAEKTFSKYCEPILHLAGFTVDIVRTDSEGYAKMFVEQLKSAPYGLVVAGGDGSVSEVLTGLMRRNVDRCPIALLPLGKTNETTKKILNLNWSSKIDEVEALLSSSLNIARGKLEKKSIFKIEQIAKEETDEDQQPSRPIYSMGSLEWGIYRDLRSLQEKYWYLWKLDKYFSALVNSFNSKLSWDCKADLTYSTPCIGCTNCMVPNDVVLSQRSIFSRLFSRKYTSNTSQIVHASNVECQEHNQHLDASNIRLYVEEATDNSKLVLESDANMKRGFDAFLKFLSDDKVFQLIKFRTMNFVPDNSCTGPSKLYSIDGEAYDVRPIKVTLVPKAIEIFL